MFSLNVAILPNDIFQVLHFVLVDWGSMCVIHYVVGRPVCKGGSRKVRGPGWVIEG